MKVVAVVTDLTEVQKVFDDAGVPAYIWKTIMNVESGGNPNAVGDNGRSFGLFQLYTNGGLGDGYNPSELKDPVINSAIAAGSMKKAYRKGLAKGLSGYELLQFTAYNGGWPTQAGVKALNYDPVVRQYETRLQQEYSKFIDTPMENLGVTNVDVSGNANVPGIEGQLQKLIEVQEGAGVTGLPVKIATMVAIAGLGLVLVFVGVKALAGGAVGVVVDSAVDTVKEVAE